MVGNDKREFSCAKFQACFVSRKVCNALSLDPTLDRFSVFPDRTCSHFHLIEDLWNSDTIDVNEHNIGELTMLCSELGNDELLELLADYPSISRDTCISKLRAKRGMRLNTNKEIEFIASNFCTLDPSVIRTLSVSELEEILSHAALKLEDENTLFDMIMELSSNNKEYLSLLRYIRFEFMDYNHVNEFMDLIWPDLVDVYIWKSIRKFILSNLRPKETKNIHEWSDDSSPIHGMFSYLRRECGGNPSIRGEVEMKASSCDQKLY